jgi:hypothetical protein
MQLKSMSFFDVFAISLRCPRKTSGWVKALSFVPFIFDGDKMDIRLKGIFPSNGT